MLLDITVNFLSISNIQAMSLLVSVSCGQYKYNFTVCFTEGTLNDQQIGKHMGKISAQPHTSLYIHIWGFIIQCITSKMCMHN